MGLKVACPSCKAVLQVPDQARGKKVKCPKCQAGFAIPAADPTDAAAAVKPGPAPASARAPRKVPPAPTEEPEPADPPKPPARKSKAMLYVLLGGGAAVALGGLLCVGLIGYFFVWT